MKKVTAFIGTETRKYTYRAVQEFEKRLKERGEVEFEYVFLSDYTLDYCRGCKVCFDRGEEYCPLKDDRDVLLRKMEESDGVVFASPNYAFHMSARMKNFLDRAAFAIHRPKFFGRPCTAVVAQGAFGGGDIVKHLGTAGANMGFHTTKGCCVTTREPMTDARSNKLVQETRKAADRFHEALSRPTPAPSFSRLMLFRVTRSSISALDDSYRDYRYYRDMGWFESDYFHETKLNPLKKLAGGVSDFVGRQMAKRD